MKKPELDPKRVMPLLETKYISVSDLGYEGLKHYYSVSRRGSAIAALCSDEEFRSMLPDAVTCIVIVRVPECADGTAADNGRRVPKLLLTKEFRYPVGQFLLSPPAGLMDPSDKGEPVPQLATARREIKEETGLVIGEKDTLRIVSPAVFSTPGMTDESNALVLAVLRPEDKDFLKKNLTQSGAETTEKFDGFRLLDKKQAKELLVSGRDEDGIFFPVYSWMAMLYFVSGLWQEAAKADKPEGKAEQV